jgi:predicted O-linked N-acetylglucosamine transferase (SPINDLY family)
LHASAPAADAGSRALASLESGNAHEDAGRIEAAFADYQHAARLAPGLARAHLNIGNIHLRQSRIDDAIVAYAEAARLAPDYAAAHYNLGNAWVACRRRSEALECFDRALELKPDFLQAWIAAGNLHADHAEPDEAEACYRRARALDPGNPDVDFNLGLVLSGRKRYAEAAEYFAKVLERARAYPYALGNLYSAKIYACDWSGYDALSAEIHAAVAAGQRVIAPFNFIPLARDAQIHLQCTRTYVRDKLGRSVGATWQPRAYAHARPRVAYLSANFHSAATAVLTAGLFEAHRRDAFDVYAFSFGPDDASPMRERLRRAFGERFFDVREHSDGEIARRLRELEIDIAIDLKGYTTSARPGILAERPAPVQVCFTAYPGTMGADHIDYLIADEVVVPPEQASAYAEKIVWMPHSYQVNDSRREIAPATPSRSQLGLPDAAFVYCSFNNTYKITPQVFAIWMRLLQKLPSSVLWLLNDNAAAVENLQRAAVASGVDPQRLVFAARADLPLHLARQRQADLFLDTLPCNAHTTASDALWAGLPVVTCRGDTFSGRVAASLLRATFLSELATSSLADYEALALALATDAPRLQALKDHLVRERQRLPLFDTLAFRDHLESAFTVMFERQRSGQAPTSFRV